jgi:pimeloyl-ACP methyl ester carboxylesterase
VKKFFLYLWTMMTPLFAHNGIVKANGIEIWYETFGSKKDPAVLLVMGGFCQGILWPQEFCQRLADSGFYVIRYDNRDTGFSTCFDFEKNPYDLNDMAEDGIALLDALRVKKAHVCGLSMGGPIGELMSIHHPGKVTGLTLIATSLDMIPCSFAYEGDEREFSHSRPTKRYLQWMDGFLRHPPTTFEGKLAQRVECWRILNGDKIPFEEEMYTQIHSEFLHRVKHPESITNHLGAIKNSLTLIEKAAGQVTVPTTILHGTEDAIFPPDHGEALHQGIKGSKYLLVEGLGHVPNRYFYDLFIQAIKGEL